MRIINYISTHGLKRVFEVLYKYKIQVFLNKLMFLLTKNMSLKDIIMIESHNDFDCNGGAFYNYLLSKKYTEKYKIVWVLKNLDVPDLPENVLWVPLHKPSIKKAYYCCVSKWLLQDCEYIEKMRSEQKSYFLTHGGGGLKSCKGKLFVPDYIDYVLVQSPKYAHIIAEQYSMEYPSRRLISIGYPSQDTLFDSDYAELAKVLDKNYKKIVIWMPTFRKGGGYKRNDSYKEQKLGIPLIESEEEYRRFNAYLKEKDVMLIIKIHPMQDLSILRAHTLSNITVLTARDVKKLGVDNYRLIKCTDAMISDYSGIAYDYLQLNRPIAYVLDDMNEYKNGFVVDDINQLMGGMGIYNMNDMYIFIDDVVANKDTFKDKRMKIRDYIFQYHDGNSCRRLAEHMHL